MAVQSLKCSGLHTRKVTVPDCVGDGRPCERVYHIFLPRVLCHGGARRLLGSTSAAVDVDDDRDSTAMDDASAAGFAGEDLSGDRRLVVPRHAKYDGYFEGEYFRVGTLPLAFLLHGVGNDSTSMMNFIALSDAYHFVLVLPEGLEGSFNAGDCCGYALEKNVDDVGFLSQIQSAMTSEFDFLKPNFSYGIGHDNGAFLLTRALEQSQHMFQSVVLISGYTHRVNDVRNRLGVEGGRGVGIMVHLSLDDASVRPSGCCDNPRMPKCRGGGAHSDYCMSVLQFFDLWAREINTCDAVVGGGGGGFGTNVLGESGGLEYSFSYEDESKRTVLSLVPDTREPQTIDTLFESDISVSGRVAGPNGEATCLTADSPGCVANSTLCVYSKGGHFDAEDFGREFPMVEEVLDFVAGEACRANNGMLEAIPGRGGTSKHVCACLMSAQGNSADDFGGVFCLDALSEDGTFKVPSSSHDADKVPPSASASNASEPSKEEADSPREQNASKLPKQEANSPQQQNTSELAEQEADSPQQQNASDLSKQEAESPQQENTSELPQQETDSPQQQDVSEPPEQEQQNTSEQSMQEVHSPQQQNISELPKQVHSPQQQNETPLVSAPTSEIPSDPVAPQSTTHVEQNKSINPLVSNNSEKPGPATTETIWVSLFLAMLATLGVTLRRRWVREKKLTIIVRQENDANLFAPGRSLSPYRDYFQRGNKNDNGGYFEHGEIGVRERATIPQYQDDDRFQIADEGDIDASEFEEHYCPYRYRGETELVNRNDKNSADDIGGGGLGSTGWGERCLPYRYPERTKQQIMDDYFNKTSSGSVNGSSSQQSRQSQQTLLEVTDSQVSRCDPNIQSNRTKQHTFEGYRHNIDLDKFDDSSSRQSQRALPDSLLHTTNLAASRYDLNVEADRAKQQLFNDHSFNINLYSVDDDGSPQHSPPESYPHVTSSSSLHLDSMDRGMLPRFRHRSQNNDQGSDSDIIRRKSDPDGEASIRNSFSGPSNVDVLDEDLEEIESEII